jgi:putative glycosyltransferase (TIGR04372 family)
MHFFLQYIPGALIWRYLSQDDFFLKLLAHRSLKRLRTQLSLTSKPQVIRYQDDNYFARQYDAAESTGSFSTLAQQGIEMTRLSPDQLERLSHVYFSSGAHSSGVRALEHARSVRLASQDLGISPRTALLGAHWTGALGHLLQIERFQQLCKAGELPYDRIVVLTPQFPIPNRTFLLRLAESTPNLAVFQVNAYRAVHRALEAITLHPSLVRDPHGFLLDAHALLDRASWLAYEKGESSTRLMTEEIKRRGDSTLKRWGIGEHDEIVCLHVRSGSFGAGRGLANADIMTYLPAIKRILNRGRRVIRMGDPSMPKLPTIDGLIDLAHSTEKSPWLDFYLWSRPRFAIGTCSGGSEAFPIFGIPSIFTNATGLAKQPFRGKSFLVPKLFKRRFSRLPMPLSEFVKSPFGASDALSHSGFEDVEIIDNTPDDITVAVDEMENLLSSVEKTIPETPAQKLLMEIRQNLSRPERSLLSRSFMDTHSYLFA